MKIKLSKSQWEAVGKKAGWFKQATTKPFYIPNKVDVSDPDLSRKLTEAYINGWEARREHIKGEWMIINPLFKENAIGRGWLRGWNDSAYDGKPKQIPSDLKDFCLSDEEIKIK